MSLRPWMLLILLFGYGFNLAAEGQIDSTLYEDEIKLKELAIAVKEVQFNDTRLNTINNNLIELLRTSLNKSGSFNFLYDSIFPISVLTSPNGKLRLFTWNTVNAKGKHMQFGFIQYYAKAKDKVYIYELHDKSDELEKPHSLSLNNEKWYGAVYYQVLENKYEGTTLYTLLGWDGNDLHSNKKVIESLVFSESGRPKFGKSVFLFGRKKAKRVIYEYSRMANMMIKYDESLKMIVMDHLSPSKDVYHGNFSYYGPDFSYDGLKFEKTVWQYIPNIDYKNVPAKKGLLKGIFKK